VIDRVKGDFDYGTGRVEANSRFQMRFWKDQASYPFQSHDLWFLTENMRWGYLPTTLDTKALIAKVNREGAHHEALAYTAGVLVAVLALGALLLGLRAAGEEIGWAFQLQEPATVVLLLVLAESFALALLGGGLGLGLAALMIAGGDPTGGYLPIFYFPEKDAVWGVVFVVLLGFVAGILPAVQAMRLRIVDALRRV